MTGTQEPGDSKVVAALLSNATVRGAAEAAGVSVSIVYRRLRDPGFRRELKEQRLRVFSHALQRLQGAVEVLEEIMQNTASPPAVRIKAAVSILELADRGTQPEVVDRKLQDPREAALEDLVGSF